MHLAPELVSLERARPNLPESPFSEVGLVGSVEMGWTSQEFGDHSGIIGDPTGASAADGERILELMVDYTARCLSEIAQHASSR